jgi:hypothetical protein
MSEILVKTVNEVTSGRWRLGFTFEQAGRCLSVTYAVRCKRCEKGFGRGLALKGAEEAVKGMNLLCETVLASYGDLRCDCL